MKSQFGWHMHIGCGCDSMSSLFNLPDCVWIDIFSDWLREDDSVEVHWRRMDLAVTSRRTRPQFLCCLAQLESTDIFNTLTEWLQLRHITVTSLDTVHVSNSLLTPDDVDNWPSLKHLRCSENIIDGIRESTIAGLHSIHMDRVVDDRWIRIRDHCRQLRAIQSGSQLNPDTILGIAAANPHLNTICVPNTTVEEGFFFSLHSCCRNLKSLDVAIDFTNSTNIFLKLLEWYPAIEHLAMQSFHFVRSDNSLHIDEDMSDEALFQVLDAVRPLRELVTLYGAPSAIPRICEHSGATLETLQLYCRLGSESVRHILTSCPLLDSLSLWSACPVEVAEAFAAQPNRLNRLVIKCDDWNVGTILSILEACPHLVRVWFLTNYNVTVALGPRENELKQYVDGRVSATTGEKLRYYEGK